MWSFSTWDVRILICGCIGVSLSNNIIEYKMATNKMNKSFACQWVKHKALPYHETSAVHLLNIHPPMCNYIYNLYIYIQFNADETPHWILAKSHNISLQLPTTNKRKWCDAIQQPRENRVYFSTIDFEVVLIYGWPYIIHEKKTTCSKHCPTKGKTVFEIARWELKAVYPTRWAWKTTYQ